MTRVVPLVRLVGPDLRTLFERAYPSFADRCRSVDKPGVALVAVDERTGNAMGIACLRARVDLHVTAIVGRHDKFDLYLSFGRIDVLLEALRVPPAVVLLADRVLRRPA